MSFHAINVQREPTEFSIANYLHLSSVVHYFTLLVFLMVWLASRGRLCNCSSPQLFFSPTILNLKFMRKYLLSHKPADGCKAAEGDPPQTRQKGICQGVPLKARRTGATLHSWTAMFRWRTEHLVVGSPCRTPGNRYLPLLSSHSSPRALSLLAEFCGIGVNVRICTNGGLNSSKSSEQRVVCLTRFMFHNPPTQ